MTVPYFKSWSTAVRFVRILHFLLTLPLAAEVMHQSISCLFLDSCYMNIHNLRTPALIIDREKLKSNIEAMALKIKKFGVNLRPHIKTHRIIEVGMLQKENGSRGITVATIDQARFFSDQGFSDIIYAVPLTKNKIKSVIKLNETCSLKVVIDNHEIIDDLSKKCQLGEEEIEILVKVDCGYHRCGVSPEDPASLKIVKRIEETNGLHFSGILAHAGHSYSQKSKSDILKVAHQEQDIMVKFAQDLKDNGLEPSVVSIGSTPTIVQTENMLEGITEVRPGNYAFFDYTQVALGSCKVTDCALTVVSSVVGKYGNRVIIDAGATALSKDKGPTHLEQECGYGKIFENYEYGELDHSSRIVNLSQEHGKISLNKGASLQTIVPGEMVRILPNHSCLTNNLFDAAYVVEDEKVVDVWKIGGQHSARDIEMD